MKCGGVCVVHLISESIFSISEGGRERLADQTGLLSLYVQTQPASPHSGLSVTLFLRPLRFL